MPTNSRSRECTDERDAISRHCFRARSTRVRERLRCCERCICPASIRASRDADRRRSLLSADAPAGGCVLHGLPLSRFDGHSDSVSFAARHVFRGAARSFGRRSVSPRAAVRLRAFKSPWRRCLQPPHSARRAVARSRIITEWLSAEHRRGPSTPRTWDRGTTNSPKRSTA